MTSKQLWLRRAPSSADDLLALHCARAARLVLISAAMCLDTRGHRAGDRRLALDGNYHPLHAGAGVCRGVHDLQHRRRAGAGLGLTDRAARGQEAVRQIREHLKLMR
jgi:hypothetical protein